MSPGHLSGPGSGLQLGAQTPGSWESPCSGGPGVWAEKRATGKLSHRRLGQGPVGSQSAEGPGSTADCPCLVPGAGVAPVEILPSPDHTESGSQIQPLIIGVTELDSSLLSASGSLAGSFTARSQAASSDTCSLSPGPRRSPRGQRVPFQASFSSRPPPGRPESGLGRLSSGRWPAVAPESPPLTLRRPRCGSLAESPLSPQDRGQVSSAGMADGTLGTALHSVLSPSPLPPDCFPDGRKSRRLGPLGGSFLPLPLFLGHCPGKGIPARPPGSGGMGACGAHPDPSGGSELASLLKPSLDQPTGGPGLSAKEGVARQYLRNC